MAKTQANGEAAGGLDKNLAGLLAVVCGGLATVAFYAAVPYLPVQREMAIRYFCGHPIEYATTALFFVGLALVAWKGLGLGRERRALRVVEVAAAGQRTRGVAGLSALLGTLDPPLRATLIGERLRDAVEHAAAPHAGGSFGEHLKSLADLAADRLHGSYALVRTVCWGIPILGFLGTVIGITMAIARINPAELSTSLTAVTGELAIAFDTTALSLTLSLILVFATFAVERAEQGVLGGVEAFALKRLAAFGPSASPVAEAETQAAAELLGKTDAMIRRQTDLWEETVESIRRRWSETLADQQGRLSESLAAGMQATLADHANGLKAAREELVAAVSNCSDRLDRTISEASRERARQLEAFSTDLIRLWDRCRGDMDDMQDRYHRTLSEAVTAVGRDLQDWRDDLHQTTEAARGNQAELARQSDLLIRVGEQSAELNRLEVRLAENLETVRAAETIQEAVHSLTAAAHLLTVRARPRAAA